MTPAIDLASGRAVGMRATFAQPGDTIRERRSGSRRRQVVRIHEPRGPQGSPSPPTYIECVGIFDARRTLIRQDRLHLYEIAAVAS